MAAYICHCELKVSGRGRRCSPKGSHGRQTTSGEDKKARGASAGRDAEGLEKVQPLLNLWAKGSIWAKREAPPATISAQEPSPEDVPSLPSLTPLRAPIPGQRVPSPQNSLESLFPLLL